MEELFACTDCAFLIANGGVFDSHGGDISDEVADRISNYLGMEHWWLVNGDSEKTIDFSKSPCEVCGMDLAGTRMQVFLDTERSK